MSDINYDASQIKVLSQREAIRKRPGMYIDTSENGVEFIILELVANVMDLFLAGKATRVSVDTRGALIRVLDDGPGLPFDQESPNQKESLVEYMLTHLHSSPTFDGHTPHLHLSSFGIGLGAFNAVCQNFKVLSWRDGVCWELNYQQGIALGSPQIVDEYKRDNQFQRGTQISFAVDETIFSSSSPRHGVLRRALFDAVHLTPGLTVQLNAEVFQSNKGLVNLAYHYLPESSYHEDVQEFVFHLSCGDLTIQACAVGTIQMQLKNCLAQLPVVHSWVNGKRTLEPW